MENGESCQYTRRPEKTRGRLRGLSDCAQQPRFVLGRGP